MAFAIAASAMSAAATASAGTVTLASTVPPVVNSSTVYAGGLTNSYCAGLNGNCVIGPPNHITTYAPQYIYEEISVPANTTITELGYYEYFTVNKAADYTSTNWVIVSASGASHPFSTSGTTIGTAATSGDPTLVTVSGLSVHIQYAGNYWIGVENNISSAHVPTVYGAVNAAAKYAAYLGTGSGPNLTHGPLPAMAFYVDAADAPEPSTWAMMILGFGGIAWLGRRRLVRARKRARTA